MSRQRDERKFVLLPGIHRQAATQAEDRIQNGSGGARQVAPQGVGGRSAVAASQEKFAIGFILNWSSGAGEKVRAPDFRFLRGTQAAMGDQDASIQTFRFHEDLGEGGMRAVGVMRGERQFAIAGQFNLAVAQRSIRDRHPPELRVVLGRHGDFGDGFYTQHPPLIFRVVAGKAHGGCPQFAPDWLIGGRPNGGRAQIPDVEEAAPAVHGGVGAPARQIDSVEAAVAATRVGYHQRVPAVSLKMGARHRRVFLK